MVGPALTSSCSYLTMFSMRLVALQCDVVFTVASCLGAGRDEEKDPRGDTAVAPGQIQTETRREHL